MKSLEEFVQEKLKIAKNNKSKNIVVADNDDELYDIILAKYNEDKEYLDCTNIDVSKCTSMTGLFSNISNASVVKTIDITGWDTSNVTDMGSMFEGLSKLEEIKGIEDIDISKVQWMTCMFKECESLKLDLSGWNVSHVLYKADMLHNASDIVKPKGANNI